jgi:proteasome assembly chaperone (PAC2) family protein
MNAEIKILKPFTPNELILVCGLPGTAYIGKLSIDYLIQQLKAELVGEVYSKYFPPYVIIKEDGLVELLRNELHLFKDETGRDIVFLSGNSQAFSPEGQYDVTEAVIDWVKME